ncbi:transposase [Patescibacteria group bacterium]|nr:transposase [Patescibacteria group bacterium]
MESRNFINGNLYHLYNRGVAKQRIFNNNYDYQRLLNTFAYYLDRAVTLKISEVNKDKLIEILSEKPKKPQVEILSFCLMPNHFHLIAKQILDFGITNFMRYSLDSYTKYFNIKYDRVGPIFQGKFKSKEIKTDEQFMHLSRYIHLNPLTSRLVSSPEDYDWSSFALYLSETKTRLSQPKNILAYFQSMKEYNYFIKDFQDYIRSNEEINELTLE